MRSADWDLSLALVRHLQLQCAVEPRNDFLDLVEVHQKGAMHAPEDLWVEIGLQFFKRSKISFPGKFHRREIHDAVRNTGINNLFGINQQVAILVLEQQL